MLAGYFWTSVVIGRHSTQSGPITTGNCVNFSFFNVVVAADLGGVGWGGINAFLFSIQYPLFCGVLLVRYLFELIA